MSLELAVIPQGLTGTALVNALNDRLRRISSALGPSAPGAPGKPGADGTGGSGDGSSGPVFIVPNVINTFTPNLSLGEFQNVVLAADSTLVGPTGALSGRTKTWTLIIDNPTAAQLTLTPDASYFIGFLIAVDALTRAQITWTNDESNDNSAAGSAFNNPIP